MERKLHSFSEQYTLKSLDIKNGSNKENLFNLIETAFVPDKVKLGSKMSIIPDKSSEHEEADTKLVALIGNASIQ